MLPDFIEQRLIRYSVTPEQVDQAKKLNATNKLGILANLQKMGVLTDKQCVEFEAEIFNTRVIKLKAHAITKEILDLVPEEIRNKYRILPLSKQGNILTLATSSLMQIQPAIPEIQKHTQYLTNFVIAYPTEISERLGSTVENQANIDEMLQDKAKELNVTGMELDAKLIDDPNGPVAQAVNHLIQQAVQLGASDIHFESFPSTLRVRFREDGILREVRSFDKIFIAPFTAAIKVMSGMDIAETRIPQDGAMQGEYSSRKVDFRVASYPTEFGEKIVMRILDSNKDWLNLDSLTLPEAVKNKLVDMIEAPQGLVLCAGPTGSGKTSTLYALLRHLNEVSENILTIEDPVEYRMQGIIQGQVNNKKGFNFAAALRAMLRLDPDVILIGEMRDKETAEIGTQAALTGHMVLSTIHTNSASQTIARLVEMGVEKFVVASALEGVISQRLLRKICPKCKEGYAPTERECLDAGFKKPYPTELFRGKGCHACRNEGYKGRIPAIEILFVTNDMRPRIAKSAEPGEIFLLARERGMWTIHEDASEKARLGLTTIEEILRILGTSPRGQALKTMEKKDAA